MKYCEKCNQTFDDTALCCEKCGGAVVFPDEIGDEKLRRTVVRKYRTAVGLVPTVFEYVACAVILVCAVIFLVVHFTYTGKSGEFGDITFFMFIMDLLVCIAIFFKGWIFQHMSWQAVMSKAKGYSKNQLLPSKPYAVGIKAAAIFWSAYNICYLAYTLWLIK